jgi:acetoin utilization protein AcuB
MDTLTGGVHKALRIKTVMTPFPYHVDADAPLAEARTLMRQHDIHHLAVKRGDAIAGVVALRDLPRPDADGTRTVEEIATGDPYVVDINTRVDEVALAMATRHIDCALVTRDGHLAGLFTASDACRLLAERLRAIAPPPPDDDVA